MRFNPFNSHATVNRQRCAGETLTAGFIFKSKQPNTRGIRSIV